MSPRAAWQLERMGFEAYEYSAGKADWISADWETWRAPDSPRQARDVLIREVATCAPETPVADLVETVEEAGSVLVVNAEGVVLGRIRQRQIEEAALGAVAEQAMRPGPVTVRPLEPLDPLIERMARAGVSEMVVTSSEGVLLGVVRPHHLHPEG